MKSLKRCQRIPKAMVALVLWVLMTCTAVGERRTDKETAGLVGPVKSVYNEEAVFFEKFYRWVEGSKIPVSLVVYDANGYMTEQVEYNADKSVRGKRTYAYDSKGNKTQEIEYHADGAIESKQTYAYNDWGYLTELVHYVADDTIDKKITYSHDEKGRMTAAAEYNADGVLQGNRVYTYNGGHMTGWVEYDADGSVNEKMEYVHDYEGQVTGYAWYDGDECLKRRVRFSSEDAISTGVRAKWPVMDEDHHAIRPATGEALLQLFLPIMPVAATAYRDTQEILACGVKEEASAPESVLERDQKTKYTYDYDSYGNWIRKTTFKWTMLSRYGNEAFTPSRVEYRTITYY